MALERMEENTKIDRMLEKQKEHNKKSKYIAKMIGANLTSYICIMIPLLLIGFIWTDSGFPTFGWGLVSDAVVTIILFMVAEHSVTQIGIDGGKLDDDYNRLHGEYITLTSRIKNMGTALMVPFCHWQIDVEYDSIRRAKCRNAGISYAEYCEKYDGKSLEALQKILPPTQALKVYAINTLKPIELTPEMILTDGRKNGDRGGIPEGADDYIDRKTKSIKHVVISIVTAAVTVLPSFALTKDVTFGRVIYTILKLVVLFMRMHKGYSQGAKAYNSVEVRHIEAKINYEYAYLEYLEKQYYLRFGDKYGNIQQFIGDQNEEIQNQCIYPAGDRQNTPPRKSDRGTGEDPGNAEPGLHE